jgi:hypothetical protein
MTTRRDDGRGREPEAERDDRVERLLRDLRQVDLPPFYRERLLARLRDAAARRAPAAWLRSPVLAWAVAGAAVAALVIVMARGGQPVPTGVPATPGAPGPAATEIALAAPEIDPVLPEDNAVVGAGEVEIVAAITPALEGAVIRLLVDEEDVTALAEVTAEYVAYSPSERFAEGEHVITIEIRDRSGRKLRDATWLFYTLDGRTADDERV